MVRFRYIVCEDSDDNSKFLFGTNDLAFARDYVFLEVSSRSSGDPVPFCERILFHIIDSETNEFLLHLVCFPEKSK